MNWPAAAATVESSTRHFVRFCGGAVGRCSVPGRRQQEQIPKMTATTDGTPALLAADASWTQLGCVDVRSAKIDYFA